MEELQTKQKSLRAMIKELQRNHIETNRTLEDTNRTLKVMAYPGYSESDIHSLLCRILRVSSIEQSLS